MYNEHEHIKIVLSKEELEVMNGHYVKLVIILLLD